MISAGRVLLMPKGDYSPTEPYTLLDVVSYQGASYVAKGSTTGNLPTDTTYWQLLASGGDTANLAKNFAEVESTATATAKHEIGDTFVDKDSIYVEATATIYIGDTIAIGTNCKKQTVEGLIAALKAYIDEMCESVVLLEGKIEIASQTDLDTVTTLGNYYKSSTLFYVTNAPTGIDEVASATFRMTVANGSDSTSTYVQSIVDDDGKTYKRGYDGSTWGDWIEYADADLVDGIDTRLTTAETDIDNLESSRLKTYASDSTAWDTAPTQSSTKPVTSGGLYTEMAKKVPTYATDSTAWDSAPTASSNKPVTSDGIKTALDNKENKSTVLTATLAANATQVTFTDAAITADCDVSVKTSKAGLNWTAVNDSTVGTLIFTFPAQSSPVSVKLIIRG